MHFVFSVVKKIMGENKIFRAIGLMSGTSLDGAIDVALIETDGYGYVKPLGFYSHPYVSEARELVRSCFGKRERDEEVDKAEALVTDIHIATVKASGFDAELIGFHGQTITHAPDDGFTWQLGDGARMAAETGIDVVCDFRGNDVKAGGQGAPLAPLYHQAIMSHESESVVVLNLGGVANVTYIDGEDLIAFDTGPANALMDDYMARHFGREFDADGEVAKSGAADEALVGRFLELPYFSQKPPKSLDRNDFEAVLADLPQHRADAMATLAMMSVASVAKAVEHFPQAPETWYACGGGRKNVYIMDLLSQALAPAKVEAIEAAGYDGDAIEAQAFAYLAVRSILGLPISLPSTTGVDRPLTGGVYHKADQS